MISKSWADDLCTNTLSDILGRRINPHLFKASAVTYLLNKGKDMKTISKFVAMHSDISTTQRYYDLREDDDADNLFD
jgi:site-specific recombinase XerD